MKKIFGFTLAEVLITLTIIGVIAAITIPNLMRKWSDHADVQKVKTAYSLLGNGIKMAVAENGPIDEWAWPDKTKTSLSVTANTDFIVNMLKDYFKIQKICYYGVTGCMGNLWSYKDISGNNIGWGGWVDAVGGSKFVLQNGMVITIGPYTASVGSISDWLIRVDINGPQRPNRYGYDVFFFEYTNNRLKPFNWGINYCSKERNTSSIAQYPSSCAYWVINHGNMDYKYRDVSAEW